MLLMYATSFLTSFTEVVFLQVRAEGAFLSSLEREPVPQVFESVAWGTELVIWVWQCAYESPVHAAKDCEQSDAQWLLLIILVSLWTSSKHYLLPLAWGVGSFSLFYLFQAALFAGS